MIMEWVRAVAVGGAIAGVVMVAGGLWSSGAIADTRVLVGEGRVDAPAPGDDPAGEDRLRELVSALTRRSRELDAREEAMAAREATLRELELAFASATAAADAAAAASQAAAEDERAEDERAADRDRQAERTAEAAPADCAPRAGVTEIYASMPAKEAAPILARLDDGMLRTVLAPMEPAKVAGILAVMSRDRAVAFTRTLAADASPKR